MIMDVLRESIAVTACDTCKWMCREKKKICDKWEWSGVHGNTDDDRRGSIHANKGA